MPNLKVIVFNVEQGFCAFIKSPTGRTLLIDCGKTSRFSPIKYVIENELQDCLDEGIFYFTKFILTHPHGDHLDDIERLIEYPAHIIYRQMGYDWDEVKEANSTSGAEKVDTYQAWQEGYVPPVPQIDWGFEIYHDALTPSEAKTLDESKMVNNSSIPVVITYRGSEFTEKFLFGGDLEEKGWLELLKRESFKQSINDTDFFITSHHGHSSGYCKEIFEVMGKPFVNIVSARGRDKSVESAYSSSDNAIGIIIGGEKRYMLSTRNDGSICIEVSPAGKYSLGFEDFSDNL
ncbi:MAG: ComEC/Rec2 family competence protein [Candidatus Hodarchaeota archaeon]